jgi:hypothetical protein
MKIRRWQIAIASLACAACLFKTVRSRVVPPPARAAVVDGLPLGVCFSPLNLDQATQQLYQNMVNILNGYTGVPNDRLNYYSAIVNADGYSVGVWTGGISSVQPNCNGYLVTVLVTPAFSSPDYGPVGVPVDSDYSEQYQVFNDNTFQYVGSLDPQGLAGQMPAIASW